MIFLICMYSEIFSLSVFSTNGKKTELELFSMFAVYHSIYVEYIYLENIIIATCCDILRTFLQFKIIIAFL